MFTLLTISLANALASRFLAILSCILAAACILMWLVVAVGTIRKSITGEMFYSPCLGTNLYARGKGKGRNWNEGEKDGEGAERSEADADGNPSAVTMVAQDSTVEVPRTEKDLEAQKGL